MSYDPPFIPESRRTEESLRDRIARARKARDGAAGRARGRHAEFEPDGRRRHSPEPWRTGRWRANGGEIILPMERPRVL